MECVRDVWKRIQRVLTLECIFFGASRIYDSDGGFYGYLTVNEYMHDRADFDLAELVCEFHELIREDVDGWYDKIFE